MLIEASQPLRVRLPDQDLRLAPGMPVDLPARYARQLLQKVPGKVRLVVSAENNWLTLWRYVAELSDGLLQTDPRLPAVLAAIARCDGAFEADDKAAFLDAVERVALAMRGELATRQARGGEP